MKHVVIRHTLVIFILFVVGIGIGFLIGRTTQITAEKQEKKNTEKSPPSCALYGYQPVNNQYYIYTVKEHDTLLSIAQHQLKDSSKIYQIISLNKEEYPNLVTDASLLKAGWELKIPLYDIGTIKHTLQILSGKIAEIDEANIGLLRNKERTHYHGMYLHHSTIIDKGIKRGDCVNLLMDSDGIGDVRVIRVFKQ